MRRIGRSAISRRSCEQTRHWPDFFQVCATLDDVRAERPFYPARGVRGMTRAAHAAALGLPGAAALSRACDRATDERPAGAPLFWTLGANQSGKAAIHAWQAVLLPALAAGDGPALVAVRRTVAGAAGPRRVAVAETYPAEALRHLGIRLRGSKRRQADRAAAAPALLNAMRTAGRGPRRLPCMRRSRTALAPTPPARTGSTASSACCAC